QRPAAIDALDREVLLLRHGDLVRHLEEMRADRNEGDRHQHDRDELKDSERHPTPPRPDAPLTGREAFHNSGKAYQTRCGIAATGRSPARAQIRARATGSGCSPAAAPSSSAWMPPVTSRQ